MRRAFRPWWLCGSIAALAAAALALMPASANAEGWHSVQPPLPSAGEGGGIGVPVPLGPIGDMKFWAPNRGLLITAGNEAVSAGVYVYDGISWHQLSTVCGGANGRIAWAGPEDFWTISDQQVGQQLGSEVGAVAYQDRSLCHFQGGQVVASYAEPIGVANSYQQMDAAACSEPNNCWFGGGPLGPGANKGAFHLHWNGLTLTPVPSLESPEPQLDDPARGIADIASFKGRFYESVQIQQGDPVSGGESASQPYLLHRIVEGSSNPFAPLLLEGPPGEPFSYGGEGVLPWELSALRLSGDPSELWAIAGPAGQSPARVTVLLLQSGVFQQIKLKDADGVFAPGDGIGGVAAEPGTQDAWVSIDDPGEASARIARVHADGTVDSEVHLPEAGEGLGHKGQAGTIACPALGDCWVATAQGWLFHLGGEHPRDSAPGLQGPITYRPPDASIPFVAPETFPEDDSGANPPVLAPPTPPPAQAPGKVRAALFSRAKARLLAHTTLALTFTLATKSHVRLVAMRRKRQVAQTRRYTLTHGRHTLRLRLDRHAWPTKIDLRVQAIGAVPLVTPGSGATGPAGGPGIVGTSFHAFDWSGIPRSLV